jgi:predicted NAD/FAD-dependent oxidoreductase
MKSSLLLGNSFAVLAAAVELGHKGQQVTLLTDGKPLGGHFAGMQLNGVDFDVGMVFIEEVIPTEPGERLSSYDPGVRNDWTRFGERASSWIRSKVDLVPVQTPKCIVEGRQVVDYLISNRLDGVTDSPAPPCLSRSDPRHASHKCRPGVFDTLTYAEASKWNHGEQWHQRYIQPFVDKVFSVSSSEFLARFHRTAWVPLYYPETLSSAFAGNPTGLAEYQFWTTPNGFTGQLVRNLCDSLARLPNVSIVSTPLKCLSRQDKQWTVVTADGRVFNNSRVAVGLTTGRTGELLQVPVTSALQAASISLLFATVKADRIRLPHGCTMIVDDTYGSYRLTDQDAIAGLDPSWHRIVLEASPQGIARLHQGKTLKDALFEELAELLGMNVHDPLDKSSIQVFSSFTAQKILLIPNKDQIARANEDAKRLAEAAPNTILTANLLGFGVASLNDQLIQALRISEEFL